MIELLQLEKEKIKKNFPIFRSIAINNEVEEKKLYKVANISRFSSWLSEEEAQKSVLNFPEEIRTTNRLNLYYKEEQKFLNFYKNIYLNYMVFSLWDDGSEYTFEKYESLPEFLEDCKDSLREKKFMKIFVPELYVIFLGTYDLNDCMLYQTNSNLPAITRIVKNSELYLLL